MNRRSFIRNTTAASVPLMLGGFSIKAFGQGALLNAIASTPNDKVLVLIQLNGGNDGLNTVIPLDQYSSLMTARGNIAIPENKVLKLTNQTGIHPSLTSFQTLFNNQKLNVVQSVGYPNQNFSHFRSTDIWLTGADYNQNLDSGWLGRYLEKTYPGFPNGYPNSNMPDPVALQIGSVLSTALQGSSNSMGMAISSANSFYQLITGVVDVAPNTPAGHELTYIRQVNQQTQQYVDTIKNAANKVTNKSTLYPPATDKNTLADQLKIVANLVAGGLKTKVYMVNLGGFDTHSAQVDSTSTLTGSHADLMNKISVAVNAFQDDIKLLGVEDRIVGMTFSEFGRRIKSNASFGTDHGAAAPLFVFGSSVNPIIIGNNPTIPTNATSNDNIPMQYDFRSIYATILQDWFQVPEADVKDVLYKDYQILPIFKTSTTSVGAVSTAEATLKQNYPNPSSGNTWIPFTSRAGWLKLSVFNSLGQEVDVLIDGQVAEGDHEVLLERGNLPAGLYYYRMQINNYQQVMSMVLE